MREEVDPIYFGRHLLLLASGSNPDGTRTVAFLDGSAKNIPEKEYQEQLAKQVPTS